MYTVVDRVINNLFHEIEKYKIRSIINLPENQASSPSIHGGEKLGLDFYRAQRCKQHLSGE